MSINWKSEESGLSGNIGPVSTGHLRNMRASTYTEKQERLIEQAMGIMNPGTKTFQPSQPFSCSVTPYKVLKHHFQQNYHQVYPFH